MDPTQQTSSGLDQNVAAALSYAAGWITGLAFLFTEPQNRFVRFHAMQSTIVFGALSVLCILLQAIPLLGLLLTIFIVTQVLDGTLTYWAILWLLLMFKAWQGEHFKIPVACDMAEQRI